jgi:polar amino acid transport system substrate-binding protein
VTTISADLAPTGTLRASINLGNPVLAQGTPEAPKGVTVDIAREVADRLGLPVEFVCFKAARHSFKAVLEGEADLCFLAIEPERQAEIAFTAPYVVIEGAYAVPVDSPISTVQDVDRPGVRVGVKLGSAYDLYLSRTLRDAQVVRGVDGLVAFRDDGLEVAAGIRAPLAAAVAADPGLRMIDDAFMQIRQAVGIPVSKGAGTLRFVSDLVEELTASGFIARSLRRSG